MFLDLMYIKRDISDRLIFNMPMPDRFNSIPHGSRLVVMIVSEMEASRA